MECVGIWHRLLIGRYTKEYNSGLDYFILLQNRTITVHFEVLGICLRVSQWSSESLAFHTESQHASKLPRALHTARGRFSG
jgi:hypothetical protein